MVPFVSSGIISQWCLCYGLFLLTLQVCHGCDESPRLSCGKLVSDFSFLVLIWKCLNMFNSFRPQLWAGSEQNSLCHCHRSYNVTCMEELPRPGFPKTCCTIQDIPLIRSPVPPLFLCVHQLFVSVEYQSHFVSVKAQRHELAPCYVVALWRSLTHAAMLCINCILSNLQISL